MNIQTISVSLLQKIFATIAVFALVFSPFANVPFASAAPGTMTLTSLEVDGDSSTTVEPSDSISLEVTVVLTGSGTSWKSINYTIQGQSLVCVNTVTAYETAGTYTESFNITAPASSGTYDIEVVAFKNTSCGATNSTASLNDAIIVEEPEPTVYTFTYTAGANGTLTGDAEQEVEEGEDGTPVTAVPNTGYDFLDWSDDVMDATRTDLNASDDIDVTANFIAEEEPVTYTLTYTAGDNGSVTGTLSQVVEEGEDGTSVTAVPDEGYQFVNWTPGDSTSNPRTDSNVTSNLSFTANFEEINESLGSIAGFKYDFDTEEGIEGWVMFIDENDNSLWDEGELTATTDETGAYLFSNLQPNGDYVVCETSDSDWTQITPAENGCYMVELSGSEKDSIGNDFINQYTPAEEIEGCMDADANNHDEDATEDDGSCMYNLTIVKVIDGETDAIESDFTYSVNGGDSTPFSAEGNTSEVSAGNYSIVENEAEGFTTEYNNCSITDLDGPETCTITNIVITDDEDDDTTTLTVIKNVINGETETSVDSDADDFTIVVTNTGNQTEIDSFEGDEEGTVITMEPNTAYSVTELVDYIGYNTNATEEMIYSADCAGTIAEGEDLVCTITNDQDRYTITGTVWYDRDRDDEQDDNGRENGVEGWLIIATNGIDTITTTSDEDGNYELNVPRGTWTITQDNVRGWRLIDRTPEPFVIVAPAEVTMEGNTGFFAMVKNFIIPTAHAAIIDSFSGPSFAVTPSSGGGGSSASPAVLGASTSDTPAGEVLGESTSVMPVGAPNTGAGGTSPRTAELPTLFAILGAGRAIRKTI